MTILECSAWRSKFRVHPAADLFPMMTKEELAKTAVDIKLNGLRMPIVVRQVDGKHEVLDGRNCLEALEIARMTLSKADVKEVELNDAEAVAFIISANIRRRHLTPGEVAALLVKLAKIEVEKKLVHVNQFPTAAAAARRTCSRRRSSSSIKRCHRR